MRAHRKLDNLHNLRESQIFGIIYIESEREKKWCAVILDFERRHSKKLSLKLV